MNKEIYLEEYPKHKNMRENVKRDKNRLHFHMMPPTGWMNDPNGLCQFHGINHIYFQHPVSCRLGNEALGTLYDQRLDSLRGGGTIPLPRY